MKRKLMRCLAVVVAVFVLGGCVTGCAGMKRLVPSIQFSGPTKEYIAETAGRRAGKRLAEDYPEVGDRLLVFVERIVGDPTAAGVTATAQIINLIAEKDPLFAAEVKGLLKLIKVEGPVITEGEKAVAKAALSGLAQGLRLGGVLMEGEGGTGWKI